MLDLVKQPVRRLSHDGGAVVAGEGEVVLTMAAGSTNEPLPLGGEGDAEGEGISKSDRLDRENEWLSNMGMDERQTVFVTPHSLI